MNAQKNNIILIAAVIINTIGYFWDVFNILLFSILRKPSRASIGLNAEQIRID